MIVLCFLFIELKYTNDMPCNLFNFTDRRSIFQDGKHVCSSSCPGNHPMSEDERWLVHDSEEDTEFQPTSGESSSSNNDVKSSSSSSSNNERKKKQRDSSERRSRKIKQRERHEKRRRDKMEEKEEEETSEEENEGSTVRWNKILQQRRLRFLYHFPVFRSAPVKPDCSRSARRKVWPGWRRETAGRWSSGSGTRRKTSSSSCLSTGKKRGSKPCAWQSRAFYTAAG